MSNNLNAGAPPFIPATQRPPPPLGGPIDAAKSNKNSGGSSNSNNHSSSRDGGLSPNAPAYAPPSAKGTSSNDDASPPAVHADPEPSPSTSASASAAPAAAAPGGSIVAALQPADGAAAEGPTIEERVAQVPLLPAVSFSDSRLPEVYGCKDTHVKPANTFLPLHAGWSLYVSNFSANANNNNTNNNNNNSGGGKDGKDGKKGHDMVLVASASDVAALWRLWRYVAPPSAAPAPPFTYAWFRQGVRPDWHDGRNRNGGSFTIVVFDRDRPGLNDRQALDDVFMAAVLAAAGESLAEGPTTLNGVMLKLRAHKPATLQLWTAHSEASKLRAFAASVKELVGKVLGPKHAPARLDYFSHSQIIAAEEAAQRHAKSLASRVSAPPKVTPAFTF